MFVKKKYPPGHIFLHEDGCELKHLAAAVVSPSVSLRTWSTRKSLQHLNVDSQAFWMSPQGQVQEGALYVVFQGSVEFYRAASGGKLSALTCAIS